MSRGFARYLYIPEDGSRYSSSVAASIEDALRDAGLAVGPDGDGTSWRPFRPAGALERYVETLGLIYPTLKVDWYDEAHAVVDPYLPPRGPWSRCPSCRKLLPSNGVVVEEDELVELTECPSCGRDFDAYSWDRAEDRTIFRSRLIISLVADGFSNSQPPIHRACPEFASCMQEILQSEVSEVFVAW